MILSDSKILEKISAGSIVIQPFVRSNLGSNSYDVTLHNKLLIYTDQVLDCKKEPHTIEIEIPETGFMLKPGTLYLGCINEFTQTKDDVILLEGKSSLARLGLAIHVTAGFGDVGYTGYLTIEMVALSKPVVIYPNQKIGQIYYQTVDGFVINSYDKKNDAKYNSEKKGPIKSKMYQNFLFDRLSDSGISFDPNKLKDDEDLCNPMM